MLSDYNLDREGKFIVKDYNNKPPFSSFLPGIAGIWGIPMWVFYVNRGQAISSFGIENKEHAILEFSPANKAYSQTSLQGFRTFLKINKRVCYEPFALHPQYKQEQELIVESDRITIVEDNQDLKIKCVITYFTLTNLPLAALVRKVDFCNYANKEIKIEVIDGLPQLIPFGTNNFFLKHMSRTIEAWMRAKCSLDTAYFRLIVDPADVSETTYIQGANFMHSFIPQGKKKNVPTYITDPQVVFGQDFSFQHPDNFFSDDFRIKNAHIESQGKTPCSFNYFSLLLKAKQDKPFYSVFGTAFKEDKIKRFVKSLTVKTLEEKDSESKKIVEDIKSHAFSVSADFKFSQYLQNTYLDNILRGGYPYSFGNSSYYVFSRKHGDLERDYNQFRILPDYFSQGESNYRDLTQNRRVDLFFNPEIATSNLEYFLNLIKIDGYNPLIVQGEKLFLKKKEDVVALFSQFGIAADDKLVDFFKQGFYLGRLFSYLEENAIKLSRRDAVIAAVLSFAQREPVADFREGYWVDHWFYNLDLIENYLYFYPDKLADLFTKKSFVFWDDQFRVLNQSDRYLIRHNQVVQGESVVSDEKKKQLISYRNSFRNFLHVRGSRVYQTHLAEKLLTIILNKSATLDAYGVGVEMEAGKPGWCDSLNGLPALFGSSLSETIELKRACQLVLKGIEGLTDSGTRELFFAKETTDFFSELASLLKLYFSIQESKRDYFWWQKANLSKERFRKKTFSFLSGRFECLAIEKIKEFLVQMVKKLDLGISRAYCDKRNVPYTYFRYEVTKYKRAGKRIFPLEFKQHRVALSLEGPVHLMRVDKHKSEKLYYALRKTSLFDKHLKMYRLNESLKQEPLEIGRSRVFVPGWLENESIFMHMEYKYLLEVLKGKLYKEFFHDFKNCIVSNFNPEIYGRSILENSTFIVSSANPDRNLWGRGFVARLSGTTVELLNIWMCMVLGMKPFYLDKEQRLSMAFAPILKASMFTETQQLIICRGCEIVLPKNVFAFTLFSHTLVVYHNPKRKDTFAKDCEVSRIVVTYNNEKQKEFHTNGLNNSIILELRNKKISRLDIYLF